MSFKKINTLEAKEILAKENAVLIDIRDGESFHAAHVSGAVHLTQDTVAPFVENTDKNTHVLVMCYHGNSSQMVAGYLAEQGFTYVYSIDGGYEGWSE